MKQHANRFANGQLGGKIAHALQQRRRDFLAASDQEQTFAGFQIFAEDHADADVFPMQTRASGSCPEEFPHAGKCFENFRVVPTFAAAHNGHGMPEGFPPPSSRSKSRAILSARAPQGSSSSMAASERCLAFAKLATEMAQDIARRNRCVECWTGISR